MPKVGPRMRHGRYVQARLDPGEEVLFARDDLWYLVHDYAPWSFGENWPIPLVVDVSFFVTNRRAITLWRYFGALHCSISQWLPGAAGSEACEIISHVEVAQRRFGSVRFDFLGLGRGRFGCEKTPFGAAGGDVPYLEILSQRPGGSRLRMIQIYMGVEPEAREEIRSAYRLLCPGPP